MMTKSSENSFFSLEAVRFVLLKSLDFGDSFDCEVVLGFNVFAAIDEGDGAAADESAVFEVEIFDVHFMFSFKIIYNGYFSKQ